MTDQELPAIKAVAPWFGAFRLGGAAVERLLDGCSLVGIPFAGGMSEVLYIKARSILVNDLHRDVVGLARVMADRRFGPELYRRLRRLIFHQDVLDYYRDLLKVVSPPDSTQPLVPIDVLRAQAYFVSVWMGRGGDAGTPKELQGKLPLRWKDAGGGDSAKRFQSAASSIPAWRRFLRRCSFSAIDGFEFLEKFGDQPGNGLYVDCPWPDAGEKYLHPFTTDQQRDLACRLAGFQQTTVVVRFGEHPLVRELYQESAGWDWNPVAGRKQSNATSEEWLIVRRSRK